MSVSRTITPRRALQYGRGDGKGFAYRVQWSGPADKVATVNQRIQSRAAVIEEMLVKASYEVSPFLKRYLVRALDEFCSGTHLHNVSNHEPSAAIILALANTDDELPNTLCMQNMTLTDMTGTESGVVCEVSILPRTFEITA